MTKIILPDVPPTDDRALYEFLLEVKRAIEKLEVK